MKYQFEETITSQEFARRVSRNPAWAGDLTKPVAVIDYCYLTDSPITHLSPLLHFVGDNGLGETAWFEDCKALGVANGTYHGHVAFASCGLARIDGLTITQANKNGTAASFYSCPSLAIAEGTYPGVVRFDFSGVERIGDLTIGMPNRQGLAASFFGCESLKVAEGIFTGHVDFSYSGIVRFGYLHTPTPRADTPDYFRGCRKLYPKSESIDDYESEWL